MDPEDINWTKEAKMAQLDEESNNDILRLFAKLPNRSHNLLKIFERLRNMLTNDHWPVVMLNDIHFKAHKTYLPFYSVAEHICFWFDPDNFCKGYAGGSSISGRPKVEIVLKNALGTQRYYAVM